MRVPVLNEAVARNRRILPFGKRADKRFVDIQKSLTFATTAVHKMADKILTASTESRSLYLRQVMGYGTLWTLSCCLVEHTNRYQMSGKNV